MGTEVAARSGHTHAPVVGARIGAVRYLNTLPLIEGLEKLRDVSVRVAPPSEMIGLIERDEVDVALASVVDCHRSTVDVALVPVGMIGCDGETRTVRVVSRVPIEKITRLYADTESHTSVVLARVIVGWAAGKPPEVVPWNAHAPGPWPDSAVVIGDKVMGPRAAEYPHSIDLGEAWKAKTGLPFVYAAWMCRADRADSAPVGLARTVLDHQRRHNATRLDWIVAKHSAAHGWPADEARHYLRNLLRFEVTDRHRGAINLFFAEASASGVLDVRRGVHWVE